MFDNIICSVDIGEGRDFRWDKIDDAFTYNFAITWTEKIVDFDRWGRRWN